MCGIVGYIGKKEAAGILLSGLRRLEYRGYDSAGMATHNGSGLERRRAAGRVGQLETALHAAPLQGATGIAHTRWATHGRPSERNAHPHFDTSGRIAVVHNGIVDNHDAIRELLTGRGIVFESDTDTEALAQLIGHFYAENHDFPDSVRRALSDIEGTFGLAVLCADRPDRLIAARRGSPLIVGVGQGEFLAASDPNAVVEHTSQVIYLGDNEMIVLSPTGIETTMTLDACPVEKRIDTLEMTLEEIELGGYEHFMLKEIHEQPAALRNALAGRLDRQRRLITLGGLRALERELSRFRRILLFGCGTAWHACLVGEYLLEELALLPSEVEYASELRYRNRPIEEGTLAIVLSQSGETADSLAAMCEVQLRGATVFGVVNAVGSTIARETDAGVYLHVGQEIGVASTKAFTGQIAVLAMIAADLGRRRHLSPERTAEMIDELDAIPDKIGEALKLEAQLREVAARFVERDNWLYLGRGVNYPVALEGALKLKETSYIHAEGMPAAEMKHGPIALIDEGMPVVVCAPRDHTYDKVLANVEEVRVRGGRVLAIASDGDVRLERLADEVIRVPATHPLLSPMVTVIPLQLLAYHAAILRGHDVDKPRNLAKSVTVE